MKTPIRFQSRLLIRRSYKPGRATRRRLRIAFDSNQPLVVPILATVIRPSPDRKP
jgi:hypothetical protein